MGLRATPICASIIDNARTRGKRHSFEASVRSALLLGPDQDTQRSAVLGAQVRRRAVPAEADAVLGGKHGAVGRLGARKQLLALLAAAGRVAVVVVDKAAGELVAENGIASRRQLVRVPDEIDVHGGHGAGSLRDEGEELPIAIRGAAEEGHYRWARKLAVAVHLVDEPALAVHGGGGIKVKLAVDEVCWRAGGRSGSVHLSAQTSRHGASWVNVERFTEGTELTGAVEVQLQSDLIR